MITKGVRGIAELGQSIWKENKVKTLTEASVLISAVAGDIAKAAKDGDYEEASVELANLVLTAPRLLADLGFDIHESLGKAVIRQVDFSNKNSG